MTEAKPVGAVRRPKILVVDDTRANLVVMRRLLARVDADLVEASSGNAALAACLDNEFALILLDVNMPDMDGFEVAALLSEDAATNQVPIIFVTAAYGDDINRLKGYRFGAVDYIAKPVNDVILLSKIRVFLELYRSKAELSLAFEQLYDRNRQLQSEIAERQRAEAEARHQATHDALTGLPNRLLFMDRIETALERARRHAEPFALSYIDIDGFKPVNDRYGHQVGDELLKAIADRLRQNIRATDTISRLGGDEFALIMENAIDSPVVALRLCRHICGALREPYRLQSGGHTIEVEIGASLGIAMFPEHGDDVDPLIRSADEAMYQAKKEGKNRCLMAAPSDLRVAGTG
jgi:diguanylate cyclase (GGDEF)-like protein